MKKFISSHKISNFEGFIAGVEAAAQQLPDGLTVHHTLNSVDTDCAVCMIEAESLEMVQDFVLKHVGEHSENTFFEISDETSRGTYHQ